MNCTQPKKPHLTRATIAVVVALAAGASAQAQRYWIEELPPLPLPGYTCSSAAGINDAGEVVGRSHNGTYSLVRATRWLWVDGVPVPEDLGLLPGWWYPCPFDVSNDGKIVGNVEIYSGGWRWVPFVWDGDTPPPHLTQLPTVPDRAASFPVEINNAGIIVGDAANFLTDDDACRWEKVGGEWTLSVLPPFDNDPLALLNGINNVDPAVIVGSSGDFVLPSEYPLACRWDWNYQAGQYVPTRLQDLGGTSSIATSINDLNQYAGGSSTSGQLQMFAFFHDGTQCINLGTPPGYENDYSVARHVNNAGTVVGYADRGEFGGFDYNVDADKLAFVWRRGVMTVLNDALVGGAGWYVHQVWDINESGQIAGYGLYNGQWRACRLTPAYGDLNCDGAVNFGDINPFVLAISNPPGYATAFPDCDIWTVISTKTARSISATSTRSSRC
jgi:uncharacterized membrane protein